MMAAYACRPNSGSEPQVGWEWALGAAAVADVIVLTDIENRTSIESSEITLPSGLEFEYLEPPQWIGKRSIQGGRLQYLRYAGWCFVARRRARELLAKDAAQILHHVTYASDWWPSPLRKLPGWFVWGPVGGSTNPPWHLLAFLPWENRVKEIIRVLVTRSLRIALTRSNAGSADRILLLNKDGLRSFRAHISRCSVVPNAVVDVPADYVLSRSTQYRDGTALILGRLLPHKGIEIALRALAHEYAADWHLRIIGDGPADHWRTRAVQLGIADRVEILGRRPRNQIFEEYAAADCLLVPSLREGSPWVAAEAASVGLPVVAFPCANIEPLAGDLAVIVDLKPNPVANLAQALSKLPPRRNDISNRWSAHRLPELLSNLYRLDAIP
jgi:glycosyltransferase involved in cell wall biosynthesis